MCDNESAMEVDDATMSFIAISSCRVFDAIPRRWQKMYFPFFCHAQSTISVGPCQVGYWYRSQLSSLLPLATIRILDLQGVTMPLPGFRSRDVMQVEVCPVVGPRFGDHFGTAAIAKFPGVDRRAVLQYNEPQVGIMLLEYKSGSHGCWPGAGELCGFEHS